MTKLDDGFDALARGRTPDLWPDIDRRTPRDDRPEPSGARRLVTVIVALAVAAAGIGVAVTAFNRGTPQPESTPTAAVSPSGPTSTPSASASLEVVGPVAVGVPFQTSAIVVSTDAVWVSYFDDTGGKLARLDPSTLEAVATIDGVPSGGWSSGGGGLAFDGNSVWVAGSGELVEIDAATDRVLQRIQLAGQGPADVVAGALGWWILETAADPDRILIESVDPQRGVATVVSTLPYAYARRIVEVGGYLAVVTLEQPDPSGGVGEPRLTLLDWEAGGSAIGPEAGRAFTSAQLVSDGANGWTLDGSDLVELDGVDLLQPLRVIELPFTRPDRLAVGAGGIWVVSHTGDLLRVDPSTGSVDLRSGLPAGAGWSHAAATGDALYLMSADGTVTRISPQE